VPAALKLQDEYQDSLQVVFIEGSRVTSDQMHAFAIDKGWFDVGTAAMWSKEAPFKTGESVIPSYALLDPTGKVLLKGVTTRDHKKIEEALEEFAKARKKGPKDLPKAVSKQVAEFYKGKPGKALKALSALTAEGSRASSEDQAAAQTAIDTLTAAVERDLKRLDWLLDNGFYAVAEDELSDLRKGLKGADEWTTAVAERSTRLESDELKSERSAEKALLKLQKKLYSKGTGKVSAKSLSAIAEKYPGSQAAARAEALIAVVEAD